jgi:hypothetical protein
VDSNPRRLKWTIYRGFAGFVVVRIFLLIIALLALAFSMAMVWQFRFERDPDYGIHNLSDLQLGALAEPGVEWVGDDAKAKLRMRVDSSVSRVIIRFQFPAIPPVDYLHLKYQVAAKELTPGRQMWDDGRFMIEWHSPQRKKWEPDYFSSIRGSRTSKVVECVMRPEQGPAVPWLRIEHLGAAGELELLEFEAVVVKETLVWRVGRWILLGCGVFWALAWIRTMGERNWLRAVIASATWVFLLTAFVVPGPWKILKPLGMPFQIQKEQGLAPNILEYHNAAVMMGSSNEKLRSVGRVPEKGDLVLRIKQYATHARSFLHALLFFAPTLFLAFLIGRARSTGLMIMLAIGIESAQWVFGYGFDWVDGADLLWDALGILLAWPAQARLHAMLPDRFSRWLCST